VSYGSAPFSSPCAPFSPSRGPISPPETMHRYRECCQDHSEDPNFPGDFELCGWVERGAGNRTR